MLTTDVVVLAGGLGTRLRSVVSAVPKVMAPIRGRPFLEYLLDHVRMCGGRRVVLAVGYMADVMERHFGREYRGDVTLVYSREAQPCGTGGALALAARLVHTSEVLVLNGDSMLMEDLARVTAFHHVSGVQVTIAVVRAVRSERFGVVQVSAGSRVTAFSEKAASGEGLINAGVYVMGRTTLSGMDIPSSLERDVLPRLVRSGIAAYLSTAPFIDIGEPRSYARLEREATDFLPLRDSE